MPGIGDLINALTGGLLGGQVQQQAPQRAPPVLPGYGGAEGNPLMAGFQNFTQAGSPMGAIGGLLTGLTTGQRTDPVGAYQQGANMAYRAALNMGMSVPQAQMFALNPMYQKAIIAQSTPSYEELQPKLTETGTDPWSGQKTFVWVYPNGRIAPADLGAGGQPMPPAGGGGTPGPGVGAVATAPLPPPPGGRGPMPVPGASAGDQGGGQPAPPSITGTPLGGPGTPPVQPPIQPLPPTAGAPGATTPSPQPTRTPGTLVPTAMGAFADAVSRGIQGEALYDYLPIDQRNLMRQMIAGELTPATLASRGIGAAQQAQMLKIATMIDPDFSPTRWQARSQMVKELTDTKPTSTGGAIILGNTAIGHLLDTAKAALALRNSTGMGFSDIAHAVNAMDRTTARGDLVKQMTGLAEKYGSEVAKFYAGGKGSAGERQEFGTRLDPNSSPQELAGAFEGEMKALQSKVQEYETTIREALGDKEAAKYPVIRPDAQAKLAELQGIVRQLRTGQAPATPPGTPGAPTAPQTAAPAIPTGGAGTAAPVQPGATGQAGTGAPAPRLPPGVKVPEGFRLAPDGRYISIKPGPGGKFVQWNPEG